MRIEDRGSRIEVRVVKVHVVKRSGLTVEISGFEGAWLQIFKA